MISAMALDGHCQAGVITITPMPSHEQLTANRVAIENSLYNSIAGGVIMIIPTVTTTECIAALADQGFNEPITYINTFNRIHENGRSVVIAATGEKIAFEDDCGIEHIMQQEAE